MIDTNKYEDAKKVVQDAGLIDENDGHPDIHYRKIALLLTEVKRLQKENQRYLDFLFWLGTDHKGKQLALEYGDEELAEMIE